MLEKTNNTWSVPGAIIIGAVIIAGAIIYAVNPSLLMQGSKTLNSASQTQDSGSLATLPVSVPVASTDHIRGNISAPITIVEFSDLQCPFCQKFHPLLQQALQEYGTKVRWVYKQFPLSQIHSQAEPAAEASECVWEQKGDDGFWQFVDGVFEKQDAIGPELFKQLARNIGVNMDQFNACVSQKKYKDKVQADLALGEKFGVNGTPTSFVNGQPLEGALPYAQLKSVIDSQIKVLHL